MVKKMYTCRECGRVFFVEYETECSAKLGRRQYCDECKVMIEKRKQKESYDRKRRREEITSRPPSTTVGEACDRFFKSRGISADDINHNIVVHSEVRNEAKERDVIEAINYGSSAFERYKKLAKRKGERENEQTQEGRNAGDQQRDL